MKGWKHCGAKWSRVRMEKKMERGFYFSFNCKLDFIDMRLLIVVVHLIWCELLCFTVEVLVHLTLRCHPKSCWGGCCIIHTTCIYVVKSKNVLPSTSAPRDLRSWRSTSQTSAKVPGPEARVWKSSSCRWHFDKAKKRNEDQTRSHSLLRVERWENNWERLSGKQITRVFQEQCRKARSAERNAANRLAKTRTQHVKDKHGGKVKPPFSFYHYCMIAKIHDIDSHPWYMFDSGPAMIVLIVASSRHHLNYFHFLDVRSMP